MHLLLYQLEAKVRSSFRATEAAEKFMRGRALHLLRFQNLSSQMFEQLFRFNFLLHFHLQFNLSVMIYSILLLRFLRASRLRLLIMPPRLGSQESQREFSLFHQLLHSSSIYWDGLLYGTLISYLNEMGSTHAAEIIRLDGEINLAYAIPGEMNIQAEFSNIFGQNYGSKSEWRLVIRTLRYQRN